MISALPHSSCYSRSREEVNPSFLVPTTITTTTATTTTKVLHPSNPASFEKEPFSLQQGKAFLSSSPREAAASASASKMNIQMKSRLLTSSWSRGRGPSFSSKALLLGFFLLPAEIRIILQTERERRWPLKPFVPVRINGGWEERRESRNLLEFSLSPNFVADSLRSGTRNNTTRPCGESPGSKRTREREGPLWS